MWLGIIDWCRPVSVSVDWHTEVVLSRPTLSQPIAEQYTVSTRCWGYARKGTALRPGALCVRGGTQSPGSSVCVCVRERQKEKPKFFILVGWLVNGDGNSRSRSRRVNPARWPTSQHGRPGCTAEARLSQVCAVLLLLGLLHTCRFCYAGCCCHMLGLTADCFLHTECTCTGHEHGARGQHVFSLPG